MITGHCCELRDAVPRQSSDIPSTLAKLGNSIYYRGIFRSAGGCSDLGGYAIGCYASYSEKFVEVRRETIYLCLAAQHSSGSNLAAHQICLVIFLVSHDTGWSIFKNVLSLSVGKHTSAELKMIQAPTVVGLAGGFTPGNRGHFSAFPRVDFYCRVDFHVTPLGQPYAHPALAACLL